MMKAIHLVLFLTSCFSVAAQGDNRITALFIVNSNDRTTLTQLEKLKNQLTYDDAIAYYLVNKDQKQIESEVTRFVTSLGDSTTIGFVYVTGGIQIKGGGLFLTTSGPQGKVGSVDISSLAERIGKAPNRSNYIVIDNRVAANPKIMPVHARDRIGLFAKPVGDLCVVYTEAISAGKKDGVRSILPEIVKHFGKTSTTTFKPIEDAIEKFQIAAYTTTQAIFYPSSWIVDRTRPIDITKFWCQKVKPRFSASRIFSGTSSAIASIAEWGMFNADDRWAWGDDGLNLSGFGDDVAKCIPTGVSVTFSTYPIIIGAAIRDDGRAVFRYNRYYNNGSIMFGPDELTMDGYDHIYAGSIAKKYSTATAIAGYAKGPGGRRAAIVAKLWGDTPAYWWGTAGVLAFEIPNAPFLVINSICWADKSGSDDVVLVGTADDRSFLLVKVKSNGTLDPAFGTGGVARMPLAGCGSAYGIARDDLGRLVVTGYVVPSYGTQQPVIAVARFLQNGMPDFQFGVNGLSLFDIPTSTREYGTEVVVISAPALSATTTTTIPTPGDTTSTGVLVDTPGGTIGPGPIAIQPPAPTPWLAGQTVEIIVGANSYNAAGKNVFTLLRVKNNGTLETNFGTNGYLQFGFNPDASGDAVLHELELDLEQTTAISTNEAVFFPDAAQQGQLVNARWWRLTVIGGAKLVGSTGNSLFALGQVTMDGIVAYKKTFVFPNGAGAATALSENMSSGYSGGTSWRIIAGTR